MIEATSITEYVGAIRGTLDPGGVYPFASIEDWVLAQAEMDAATSTALGGIEDTDFYLIARLWDHQPVYRVRWTLEAAISGPLLLPTSGGPHTSLVKLTLRRYPLGDKRQILTDPADDQREEMPYRDALTGVQPALLLRDLWGPGPRNITIGGWGTVTFTRETLEYTALGSNDTVSQPYNVGTIAEYPFALDAQESRVPALWLAPTGADQGHGWKLSYCAATGETADERWDEPDEPVPPFSPLTASPPWQWPSTP